MMEFPGGVSHPSAGIPREAHSRRAVVVGLQRLGSAGPQLTFFSSRPSSALPLRIHDAQTRYLKS